MAVSQRVDILLVDDREDGLIALEALLGDEENYRLVKASSGFDAIGLLDHYDFSMVLLDVQMPEMDGFEAAKIIRSQSRYRSLPIIFVTAINKDERYIYQGYEAGAVDYVFKPFDPMILKSKVAIFADLHVKNRQLREQARQLAHLENLRRYQNLADSIPHMVLRALPAGSLEYHNKLWTDFTGLTSEESRDTGWQKAIHPDDLPLTLSVWSQARRESIRFESECRIRRHDGIYRWFWVKAEPEVNSQGQVIAWLGTCTDIDDRKTVEQQLKEAQASAEAANDAKTHFLANMSHEIRTPLNAIMGFTELLLDPEITPEEKLKSISIVRRNCHQLLRIVDEILDISKVEAGELVTEQLETRTVDLLNEIKTLMTVQAAKKEIGLDFHSVSRLPTHIMTDAIRLRQILTNIIGNAIKFTMRGSVQVECSFDDSDGKSTLQFKVTDTGVGIDQKSSEKIFLPFSQADSSTTRLFGGTGLGLALARRLARAMGGDVKLVDSQPGAGSCFSVAIDVRVLDTTEWVGGQNEDQHLIQPAVSEQEELPLMGKRILLVEDAEDNQFLIKQFLSRTGAEVDVAWNGEEGVNKALNGDYEVILMDIQMPFVDGYQATSRLRKAGYRKPIIALTAHALVEERERCLSSGCDGHLTKPINRRHLIESLVEHIQH